jgi:2-amino-4-hydroxy-6-hydroxymethyldihydropteridine diphosphokinase
MAQSLISLGANLGNARSLITLAGEQLLQRFGADNVRFSRLYRSPAIGGPEGQADFFNAVATLRSGLSAFQVWQQLHEIEQGLGRQRRHRWEARRIDLDVLLHEDERIWTPKLKIPHPRMHIRTFVLEPASEIAGDWIDPVTGSSLQTLAARLRASSSSPAPSHGWPRILILVDDRDMMAKFEESWSYSAEGLVADHGLTLGWIKLLLVPRLSRQQLPVEQDAYRRNLSLALSPWLDERLNLLAYAGASPDPTTVLWEDFCRPWAELLGMIGHRPAGLASDEEQSRNFAAVPKYLLAGDDPAWAFHEVQAALAAMRCQIYPCGSFFASG